MDGCWLKCFTASIRRKMNILSARGMHAFWKAWKNNPNEVHWVFLFSCENKCHYKTNFTNKNQRRIWSKQKEYESWIAQKKSPNAMWFIRSSFFSNCHKLPPLPSCLLLRDLWKISVPSRDAWEMEELTQMDPIQGYWSLKLVLSAGGRTISGPKLNHSAKTKGSSPKLGPKCLDY